ncbi:hypothetical protein [Porcipelethomonas sp.]|uniref:hypothetical protein n=1 Tax=Porcipelethomonas sp. TaxID=2981675 RepID=UPI003EF846E5
MKTILHKIAKYWPLIWLILSISAVLALTVLGAYTGVNSVKHVLSTQAPSGVLFSSNSLKASTGNSTISSTQRLSSQEYDITVCNYEQIKAAEPNSEDITYNLTASLQVRIDDSYKNLSDLDETKKEEYVKLLENRSYKIKMQQDDGSGDSDGSEYNLVDEENYQHIFTGYKLTGNQLSTDVFRITFDASELEDTEPDFYIFIKAEPTSPSGIESVQNLYCAAQSASEASAWSGSLLESDCETVDYDFYNYILSGNGKGTIEVMWDSTMFEVNPFFLEMEQTNVETISGGTHAGWSKITLEVDSTKENRYDIQLYKTSNDITSYTGAYNASQYIDCIFTNGVE